MKGKPVFFREAIVLREFLSPVEQRALLQRCIKEGSNYPELRHLRVNNHKCFDLFLNRTARSSPKIANVFERAHAEILSNVLSICRTREQRGKAMELLNGFHMRYEDCNMTLLAIAYDKREEEEIGLMSHIDSWSTYNMTVSLGAKSQFFIGGDTIALNSGDVALFDGGSSTHAVTICNDTEPEWFRDMLPMFSRVCVQMRVLKEDRRAMWARRRSLRSHKLRKRKAVPEGD